MSEAAAPAQAPSSIALTINGVEHRLTVSPTMPLLWAIRDVAGLTGTKFGCGAGLCGSCTIHIDGEAVRSCITPVAAARGRAITTIEGLSADGTHPVQRAWAELNVVQCGYCQAGQIMNAAAFLARNTDPSEEEIHDAMEGNACRCGTYPRIRAAVLRAAELGRKGER
ncbi:MAG: (2Fe-2S)-binding protein [Planctomycetes bacterium]|nr:(2Fe-2S)-binding protein [Planctomycetota bacterium]